jgi:hypothetical protein
MVKFTIQPLYLPEKSTQYTLKRRLGGPQGRCDRCEGEKSLSLPASASSFDWLDRCSIYVVVQRERILNLVNNRKRGAACHPVEMLYLKDVYWTRTSVLHVYRKKAALIWGVLNVYTDQNTLWPNPVHYSS